MPNFLPPTPSQINDMASFIELLKVASKEDTQALVAQMKEISDNAVKAQAAAGQTFTEANAKLKEAQDLVDSVKKDQEALVVKQAKLETDAAGLDERAKQIGADRAQLDRDKADQEAALKARESAVTSRENTIDEREQDAAKLEEVSKATIADYEARLAKMQKAIA